jgi:glyoxylase-like metal-dependent hydrolase (beta-lactamase superfamily II)
MLAYETLRQVTPLAGVVLADNPNPMTLDGTNTWILRDDPGRRRAIVVDPGPASSRHLDAVLDAAGGVALILLTHAHLDHSEGVARLRERTGADVLALDPAHRFGSEGLVDGSVVQAAGVAVRVLATPGHTADSLSFVLPGASGELPGVSGELPGASGDPSAVLPGASGDPSAVLTGDTILGRGTTVVAHPDGVLGDYLDSLRRLSGLRGVAVLPGHGPELADAGMAARAYLAHREQRLEQIRAAIAEGGEAMTPRQVVERVYADVDRALWPAAELSVRAQLAYLRG